MVGRVNPVYKPKFCTFGCLLIRYILGLQKILTNPGTDWPNFSEIPHGRNVAIFFFFALSAYEGMEID